MRRIFRFQSLGRLHHHKLDFNHKSKVGAFRIHKMRPYPRHHKDYHYHFRSGEVDLYLYVSSYRLSFQKWGGAVATIEEEQGSEVWGVLWQVSSTLEVLVWFGFGVVGLQVGYDGWMEK